MSSVGPWESVGGDIKFLRLKQRAIGGLVTDGTLRFRVRPSLNAIIRSSIYTHRRLPFV
jgi:hypothetical protein